MSTKKEPLALTKSNGAEALIEEIKLACGVYAEDIKKIREGKDGREGSNLKLLGKKGADASFQKIMTLLSNVPKIKELLKEDKVTKTVKQEEVTTITEEVLPESTEPTMSGIQDFALNKLKKS